ncbi:uncharacterized protein LOC126744389 isoform X1 [Anthonomus grandis grandis]|uniref:uncharacterized protein LOC126744389 isoform X1 n=1 Tax=Anthonomus grandis grandis TaxID=2921223 RepID=UPI0021661D5E|nr:uncharacterized protein LOC126744389 isoform X1 [Anthonomus grandis grandis]XP_050307730.1 uncharacterized protein LOC126744389 isoform X1 [Anthonomus grandis grandis]XP_050307731.1 uncharacterized protein LOC126744389 isoform X1 [Anthonomus grandis grandis]
MRVVALVSGGKDSTYNMMQCIAAGHEIVALANLVPHNKTEIDSYMYQSVGHEAIDLIAEAIDLPLFRKETLGISKKRGKTYDPCEDDEVEDLFILLQEIQQKIEFNAVSVGAILSDYQRVRVENVCGRLNLTPLAYLWQRNQRELLDEMIKCEVDAIIIKTASLGLEPKHLGRSLSLLQPHLFAMNEKYGLNVCGEGGEYETMTLDCPLFSSRLVVGDFETVMHHNDPIAPVGFLKLNSLSLEFKLPALDLKDRLDGLPLKDSYGYVTESNEDETFEITDDDPDSEHSESALESDLPDNRKCLIKQSAKFGFSNGGWLWLGGIQGDSDSPADALEQAISKLKFMLKTHSHTLEDVCAVTLYISDMSQFLHLNEIYVKNFNFVNPPTRACVQVPINCPVIMEALSWKNIEIGGDPDIERYTLHVQSISHWAPCNIGPYSQATKVGDFINLAGQIALVPGNLQMVSGGIKAQCKLVVRHIDRILKAVESGVNVRDVVQGICYVAHSSFIEPARKHWEAKTNNAIVEYVVVTGLPRGALIEWHVWAHKHNNQFEYEERGKCIDDFSISLYRRVNYDRNVAAVVCRVESIKTELDLTVFEEALKYSIEKLKQNDDNQSACAYNLKIFFSVLKVEDVCPLINVVQKTVCEPELVYTFIPVVKLKNTSTFLSIVGIKIQ